MFNKLNEPVFLKDDSSAEKELEFLKTLPPSPETEQYIKCVEAGIIGEKQIRFELANSHMPMYVLHDVFLEHNGLTAQIDYMVICRKYTYLIECKNLYGNIEINEKGDFIRTVSFGKFYRKEGIYSPITQSQRHLSLIEAIIKENFPGFLKRLISTKWYWKTVVVLANPKTVLNDKHAPKEVKSQVIRADQLIAYIKECESKSKEHARNDKELKDIAESWLKGCAENPVNYAEKYSAVKAPQQAGAVPPSGGAPLCPKCNVPMVKRTSKRGDKKGEIFWGCPNFPRCWNTIPIKEVSK